MKKVLFFLMIVLASTTFANAEEVQKADVNNKIQEQQKINEERLQRVNAFEKRLGLTDFQKEQAKEIRFRGHFELGPVLHDIRLKKQEEKIVKMSKIAIHEQELRLEKIKAEIKDLEKQAKEIRKKNMKEFEEILSKQQKKILKQMKKEGRKRYHDEHPVKIMQK